METNATVLFKAIRESVEPSPTNGDMANLQA